MATVTIDEGILTGGIAKTDDGSEYFEFLEVPYAKPPVGALRFKAPQPPESWQGERLATTATKIAIQVDYKKNVPAGTEDCLYLNVYTPKNPNSTSRLLPVMVSIHGGGYIIGNGTIKEENGPDFFMDQEIIIVTINYRLSVFGFLSLDIPESAGNMGLKDQVMALQWVQRNIGHFGGNKNNVTIFGISAGGASVEYLMLSPLAKGLFNKAIIQSGSGLNGWAITYEIKSLSYKLAQRLGFAETENDVYAIYNFLMKQSTNDLLVCYNKLVNSISDLRLTPGFVPSIEKDFGDGKAFLTENPYNLLAQGRFNKVPVIRGFCDTEGILSKVMKPQGYEELRKNKNFLQVWPYNIEDESYNEKLKKAYLKNNSEDFCTEFYGDFDFVSGIWIASKFMVQHGVPLYLYELSYSGKANFTKNLFRLKSIGGAAHGDDTSYIYKVPNCIPTTESDKLTRDRFINMWTNFAKSGNPTPEINSVIPLKWERFTEDRMIYLNINEQLTLRQNYEQQKMDIFAELYEKYKK